MNNQYEFWVQTNVPEGFSPLGGQNPPSAPNANPEPRLTRSLNLGIGVAYASKGLSVMSQEVRESGDEDLAAAIDATQWATAKATAFYLAPKVAVVSTVVEGAISAYQNHRSLTRENKKAEMHSNLQGQMLKIGGSAYD